MTRDEIKKLMMEIVKVYPRFDTPSGAIDAWLERLNKYPLPKALNALNRWIEGDKGDYPPTLSYFVKAIPGEQSSFVDNRPGYYKLVKGRLYWCCEGEEYETGNPDEEPYYTNKMGYICRQHNGQEVVIGK